jgi:hypothetical protein
VADFASGADRPSRPLFDDLITGLPAAAETERVVVGLHWTAVICRRQGKRQCGLASTVPARHAHGEADDVAHPGALAGQSPGELASLVHSDRPAERSIGLAAINACLPAVSTGLSEESALDLLAGKGANQRVGLIGHFPFIDRLRPMVGELMVLELEPQPDELPADSAAAILPTCRVVAITSMTMINGTFAGLMDHVDPGCYVVLLGPSSPLSPIVFDHGVDAVAGTLVTEIDPVVGAIAQGANYRQVHRLGTHLVTMTKARRI